MVSKLFNKSSSVCRNQWYQVKLHEVEYRVPQSFLVGPGLLSIYVNEFSESVLQGELHMYADDARAFVVGAIQTS